MPFTVSGVEYLDPSLTFDPTGVAKAESLDGMLIVPVPNAAARDALATSFAPTPSRPLYVARADAPAGAKIEMSTGLGGFRPVATGSPGALITPVTNWSVVTGSFAPKCRRVGETIIVTPGRFARTATGSGLAHTAGFTYSLGQVPVGYRPEGSVALAGIIHYGMAITPVSCKIVVEPSGLLSFTPAAGGTFTTANDPLNGVSIPMLGWEAMAS